MLSQHSVISRTIKAALAIWVMPLIRGAGLPLAGTLDTTLLPLYHNAHSEIHLSSCLVLLQTNAVQSSLVLSPGIGPGCRGQGHQNVYRLSLLVERVDSAQSRSK